LIDVFYGLGKQPYTMWYWHEYLYICRFFKFLYEGVGGIGDYIFSSVRIHYVDTAMKLSIADIERYSPKHRIRSWRRRFRVLLIVARLFGSLSWHDIILSPAHFNIFNSYDFIVDDLEWEWWSTVYMA
jgi:hypothetical protein